MLKIQKIKPKTPSKLPIEPEENKSKENGNNQKEIEIKKDPKEYFMQDYGFTAIIEAVIESKKPIIGHYLMLDLLFIYDSFIDELPDTYAGFVKEISHYFPIIFDTKLLSKICQRDIVIKNSLEELFYEVFEHEDKLKPFHNVILAEGFSL